MRTASRNTVAFPFREDGDGPPICCFLYDADTPVDMRDETLRRLLPTDRAGAARTPSDRSAGVTYGDGFRAVQRFLSAERWARPLQAVQHLTQEPIRLADIREIQIRLEKHGAFYHPFRVTLVLSDRSLHLAVNIAVSEAGRRGIQDEFHRLRRFDTDRIPRVFAFDRVRLDAQRRLPLFLAEWFEDHHEFHLCRDPRDGSCKPALWLGGDRNPVFLTEGQARAAYRGVAAILTGFYGLATTERVTSWHHAAGDFVLHLLDEDHVDVRLITLRDYRPMMANPTSDPETALDALVVFLLDLSIRNRLDRLDGVGEIAWAEGDVVEATIEGFAQALRSRSKEFPSEGIGAFFRHLASYPPEEMVALFDAVVSRFPQNTPEASLARRGSQPHVEQLLSAVQTECRRWGG